MNILITSAGRRVSLVRAFRNELNRYFPGSKVYTVDLCPELSAACNISDGAFKVPPVKDKDYIPQLIHICKANNIRLIIPTIDTELAMLSASVEHLSENGIIPVISTNEIVDVCRDKRKTNIFFDSISFPRSRDVDTENCIFPVFAKPSDGSSSIGIQVVRNKTQLNELVKNDKMMFVEYLNPVDYAEFTIDMYFDRNHYLKCAVPRERIEVRTGEVSKSVTRRGKLYELVRRKFEHCAGLRGCITLQVFINRENDQVTGIEINPRFGGGYPLSYQAGANYPEMIIKEYLCNKEIPFFAGWTENLLMLRYDEEVIVYDYKG